VPVIRAHRRGLWAILACALIVDAWAPPAQAGVREQHLNQVGVELGGRMPLFGIEYERWLNDYVGFGLGLGGVPCTECVAQPSGHVAGEMVFTIPAYVVVNLPFAENHGFTFSAGTIFVPPGQHQDTFTPLSLGAGYQLLSNSGFVLRASFLVYLSSYSTGGVEGEGPAYWAGLQIGWGF
jgi:hypothetical protein